MTDEAREIAGDERGIDVAIVAFVAARMTGETTAVASRHAEAMLELFGFSKGDSDILREGQRS